MKKITIFLVMVLVLVSCISFIFGCSTVQYVTPKNENKNFSFENLTKDNTNIEVKDYRNISQKDKLCDTLQVHLEEILNSDKMSTEPFTLQVDILDYKAYFSRSNWNADFNVNIKLIDKQNTVVFNKEIRETETRYNMWGYGTAKEVSQQVYDKAIASIVSSVNDVLRQ